MCTDVDRNDKSRICVPGSVKVIGRRQIELYSRLIHTVDHVEGTLLDGFDAIDAFLSHMWAVTVTGAPKLWAMRFIESRERSPRRWYGGAFGRLGFDGDADTGLTLRTVHVSKGIAETRAGGTLLIDSDADAEEVETEIKASAFLDALTKPVAESPAAASTFARCGRKAEAAAGRPRGLVRPHAGQLLPPGRCRGADRTGAAQARRARGRDRGLRTRDAGALARSRPAVGLRGRARRSRLRSSTTWRSSVSASGCRAWSSTSAARLGLLGYPMHGKASQITVLERGPASMLFDGLPREFRAGRYHSHLRADVAGRAGLQCHHRRRRGRWRSSTRSLPVSAVQFHPESIMSADGETGLLLVRNVVESLVASTSALS